MTRTTEQAARHEQEMTMQTVRRVRHDVADGLALMAFSLGTSVVVAVALGLLVGAL